MGFQRSGQATYLNIGVYLLNTTRLDGFLSSWLEASSMECTTSISQSLTDFAYNQSNFIQTTIMLGFISLVFLLSAMLWISTLFGKSFQQLLSDKIQDWTGALCVVTIISVLCSAAIEMNYWTGNQIPSCILDGMISSTKAVSMIVIFTLQFLFVILFVKEFIRVRLSDRERERWQTNR